MFQCWKSHDEQDSHLYVFVRPILQSQPKQKGLNIVPLNPTQYSKVYCLELSAGRTKICVQISESAQAKEFPWAL